MGLGWVPEGAVQVEDVPVAPTGAFTSQVTGPFEVGDHGLDGTLGDVAGRGEGPQPDILIAGDGHEHAGVVGQEGAPPVPAAHEA
ncbi:hypothetical protein [Streptomyces rimosus]|uniref:hypothetical protein n=1 Tax=Streptomyces rimosus TaxID=1927 RepID=UPI0013315FB9|nr:hypothetical protein [Streptomyces rimosus]